MNYSHSYHAGSFSDVFKHVILITLIKSMLRKDAGFCYLDTHSGPGFYDFFSEAAQKNKEYDLGITKLLQKKDAPDEVKLYLNCMQRINNRLKLSIHHLVKLVEGEADAMIRKPVLREVVRADFLRAVAGADHLLAFFGEGVLLPLHFDFI